MSYMKYRKQILQYLYDNKSNNHCIKCLYEEQNEDIDCEECLDNYDSEIYKPCDFHQTRLCFICYHYGKEEVYIIYKILKKIFKRQGEEKFIEIRELLNIEIPYLLEKIMTSCLLNCEFQKARIMLKLGADINFDFKEYNPNFTLIHYFFYLNKKYNDEFMNLLDKYKYDFDIRNSHGNTILGTEINLYISNRYETNNNIIKYNIIKLLKFGYEIAYENFNYVVHKEYGDKTYDYLSASNHYWRRQRIDWLIKKGMCYWFNRCVNKKHPNCSSCRQLRDTRLGWYLLHHKMREEIRNY